MQLHSGITTFLFNEKGEHMSQVATLDTTNFEAMAKAAGIANEVNTGASSNSLPRLRIMHTPIMGTAEVNGKTVNVEVVNGGSYKLEMPNKEPIYSTSVKIRPFAQRYMHKRFVQGDAKNPNRFIKTVMSDTLDNDLKDNDGGFNCGKAAGFIKDWEALPKKQQDLLRSIKRVRSVFGQVEMIEPTNESGEPVTLDTTPFIWEIDNKEAFKEIGTVFQSFAKMGRLPLQHAFTANTAERKIPTGASYFVPVASLDLSSTLEMTTDDKVLWVDFQSWIDGYNNYILQTWKEKAEAVMEEADVEVVDDLVDIEVEDVA